MHSDCSCEAEALWHSCGGMQENQDHTLLLQRAFLKLVLPVWLHGMLDSTVNLLAAADDTPAIGKRPRKRKKSNQQVLDSKLRRDQVLEKLNETFFIPVEARAAQP